jgi:hypothetical protein
MTSVRAGPSRGLMAHRLARRMLTESDITRERGAFHDRDAGASHEVCATVAVDPLVTRSLYRARLVALAVAGFLAVWCVVLGVGLPTTAVAGHWSLAWAGLDAAEAAAALATAILVTRSSTYASFTAIAGATLLLIDAWLDVSTAAPGFDSAIALVEAVVGEIPLAVGAVWLALTLQRSIRGSYGRSRGGEHPPLPDGADADEMYYDSHEGALEPRLGAVPRQREEVCERQRSSLT